MVAAVNAPTDFEAHQVHQVNRVSLAEMAHQAQLVHPARQDNQEIRDSQAGQERTVIQEDQEAQVLQEHQEGVVERVNRDLADSTVLPGHQGSQGNLEIQVAKEVWEDKDYRVHQVNQVPMDSEDIQAIQANRETPARMPPIVPVHEDVLLSHSKRDINSGQLPLSSVDHNDQIFFS